jgi:hypothetical protein
MKLDKVIFLMLFPMLFVFSLASCNNPIGTDLPHEHSFGDWQSNADEHWRLCDSDKTEERSSHIDETRDELCDECGYDLVNDDQDDNSEDSNDDDDQSDNDEDSSDDDQNDNNEDSNDDDQSDNDEDSNDDDQNNENNFSKIFINEVRTEYANPKVEFIEFKIMADGDLGSFKVFAAGNSIEESIFDFPSANVKAGEYVVLYLRKLDPASVDETGNDLDISPGAETSATSREFWVPDTTKLTRKTDILFIKDQDDQIVDALMMSETQDASWSKTLTAAADLLGSNAAWRTKRNEDADSPGPIHAVASEYATTTRTICRDESVSDSNTANDWYVSATSGATPGAANSDKRYESNSK